MKIRAFIGPLVFIISLMGLLHWFVYSMVTQSMMDPSIWIAVFFTMACLLIPVSLILSMSRQKQKLLPLIMVGYVWLGTFAIALFFSCVQLVIFLSGFELSSQWMFFVVPVVALWALRINIFGPQIVKHKIQGPEFMSSLRVVQISDLHIGNTILGRKWLAGVVDQILNLKPDVVVVTGDLADGQFNEVVPMLQPLERIQCQKFYITGNHEYIRGGDWEGHLQKLGFEVLHNTHALIRKPGGTLLVGGVPDRNVDRFIKGQQSSPDKALATTAPVDYKILLAHEPSSVFDLKKESCDLILAGHTHGGQIFPFGLLVKLQQPVVAGFKMIKGVNVFAHQGTGFWGPPMRWFTKSEIVEFTWK